MKKLLILLILLSTSAFPQQGSKRIRVDTLISFTPSSFVRMNDSVQLAQFIEADSTGFPIAPSFGKSRLVFRADSGIYYWDGNSRVRLDSSGMGRITRVLESDGSPSIANVDSLQFNSTNFSLTNPSGARVAVNTIQNIDTTATPKFSGGSIVNSFTAGDASLLISSDYAAGQNAYIEFDHQPTIGNHYVFKFGSGIGLLRTAFTLQDVTDSKDIYYGFLGGGLGIGSTTNNGLLTVGNAGQFYVDTLGNVTTNGKLTLSSLTSGSIPFVGTGGTIRENNSKLYWDSTNARLGVFGQPADVYGSKLEVFGKGRFVLNSSTWPTTAAGGANWGVRDSWLYGVSDSGDIGVGGFSRTSKAHNGSNGTIGVGGFVINDSSGRNAWAMYGDVQMDTGNITFGLELAVKNKTTDYTATPYSFGNGAYGIWIAAGGDSSYGGAPANPSNTAIVIGRNASTWNQGILFRSDGLTGDDGTTGTAPAIRMAKGHIISWRAPSDSLGASIRSDVTNSHPSAEDVGILFSDSTIQLTGANGAVIEKFQHQPSAVNYIQVNNSATTAKPQMTVAGSDGNIGLNISTKGTGILQLSTNSLVRESIDGSGNVTIDTSLYYDAVNNRLGVGTTSPLSAFHLITPDNQVTRVADATADATQKDFRLGVEHYTNSEEPMALIMGQAGSSTNVLSVGGGTGLMNAATSILFFTATGTTTTTGTQRLSINNDGSWTGNSAMRGSDAFTTTATEDTVTITGATINDFYQITLTGTAAPSANDGIRLEKTSTGFILHRSASGTSGLAYDWLRIK